MSLGLSEYSIHSEYMFQHFVKEDERDVEFFLVKDLQPESDIFSQPFPIHGRVVLAEPVGVEDWSLEGFVPIDSGKVAEGDGINIFISPSTLVVIDQTILEKTKGFMCPKADESFYC